MKLNDVFEHIYVISIPSQVKRKYNCKKELNGIKFKWFNAVCPKHLEPPQRQKVGNRLSHLEILKKAKKNNFKNVLVFEDDILFDKTVSYEKFLSHISDFLKNYTWACFYLGGHHRGKNIIQKITNHVVRTKGTVATHAIAYHSDFYDDLIELYSSSEDNPDPIDYFLIGRPNENKGFVYNNPCFCVYPRFVLQRPGRNIKGQPHNESYWRENL